MKAEIIKITDAIKKPTCFITLTTDAVQEYPHKYIPKKQKIKK